MNKQRTEPLKSRTLINVVVCADLKEALHAASPAVWTGILLFLPNETSSPTTSLQLEGTWGGNVGHRELPASRWGKLWLDPQVTCRPWPGDNNKQRTDRSSDATNLGGTMSQAHGHDGQTKTKPTFLCLDLCSVSILKCTASSFWFCPQG